MGSRITTKLHPNTLAELKKLQKTHGGATYDTLIQHLVLCHDMYDDARIAKGLAATHINAHVSGKIARKLVIIEEIERDYEALGDEGFEKKYGSKYDKQKIIDSLGLDSGAVHIYEPRFGKGRPEGAKDLKPRTRRTKKEMRKAREIVGAKS